jgi:hypothetical protein
MCPVNAALALELALSHNELTMPAPRKILCLVMAALVASTMADEPAPLPSSAKNRGPRKADDSDRGIFLQCMNEFRKFRNLEILDLVGVEPAELQVYQRVNDKVFDSLSAAQQQARMKEFNLKFQRFQSAHAKLQKKSIEFKERLAAMPLTTTNTAREALEINARAHEDTLRLARMKLIIQSLECNKSLTDYVVKTPAAEKLLTSNQSTLSRAEVKVKKWGKYGGSRQDRSRVSADEKLNLTPVDPEFYQTQLGKKLEKDLGGRVDFWSYDYQRDELYVQVGDEVAKIGVIEVPGGSRIIKTKVGPRFDTPKAPDEKVNFSADGRFLTGDKNQETLFGKMPSNKPTLIEENKGGAGDHDPNHDH